MSGKKKGHRACGSCIHYGTSSREEGMANCRITTYKKCDPDTCPWYMNKQMQEASFEKARQNYIKRHGKDEYYELGYGPKDWRGQNTKDWEKEDEANAGKH